MLEKYFVRQFTILFNLQFMEFIELFAIQVILVIWGGRDSVNTQLRNYAICRFGKLLMGKESLFVV